jgi:NAD(P)-dependent dehydrogenase (short-subunit alcohol dehydrogenase family)
VTQSPAAEGGVVIITGASGGIGAGICTELEQTGWQVVATDVAAPDRPSSTLDLALDVTDSAAWANTVASVVERYGRVDGLVNVAGIVERGRLHEVSDDSWNKVIAVNQTGTFLRHPGGI